MLHISLILEQVFLQKYGHSFLLFHSQLLCADLKHFLLGLLDNETTEASAPKLKYLFDDVAYDNVQETSFVS